MTTDGNDYVPLLFSRRSPQNGANSRLCGTTGGTSILGCCIGLRGEGRSPSVTLMVCHRPSRKTVSSIDCLAFSCPSTLAYCSLDLTSCPLTAKIGRAHV